MCRACRKQIIEEIAEDLILRQQTNLRDITTASATNLNSFVELDIRTIDKNNATQMDLFFKITCFNYPSTIPRDAANIAFPLRLLTKTLSNSVTCTRDCLCWSKEKQYIYCVPCFIANKINTNQSSLSAQSGWNIVRGLRKLKDKIPSHENSTLHKENYIA